ncbi:hypothetical protein Pryu01_00247 [Paraliobacillus ryukyuensis]|uniref:Uncharacterized protein n=1 Tax=Paraliobacillus ryukyuensis TaxID=200904 RepID=A0A366EGV5_9BACI|nr:hypothetical protein DES48_101424 [Paraliobacillus ryukyuensis]
MFSSIKVGTKVFFSNELVMRTLPSQLRVYSRCVGSSFGHKLDVKEYVPGLV